MATFPKIVFFIVIWRSKLVFSKDSDFTGSPFFSSNWDAFQDRSLREFADKNPMRAQMCISSEDIKAYARNLAIELKKVMHDGIKELNVPKLDPLFIPKFPFSYNGGFYQIKGKLMNVSVERLSTFQVVDVSTNFPSKNDLRLMLKLPYFTASGLYDLSGSVFAFPVFGYGPFKTKYTNVFQSLYVEVAADKDNFAFVKNLNYTANVTGTDVDIRGLMGFKKTPKLFKSFFNSFSLRLFKSFEPHIRDEVNKELQKEINYLLKKFTFPVLVNQNQKIMNGIIC